MIYFCIPALNEERTVGVVLWKLRQVMTELQRDFQIIVVDDASTDASQAVLNPYVRVLPLTLVRNENQLGYAASMEIAIREAVRRSPYPKRDAIITLQGDFTEDPETVAALIKRVEAGADLVASEPTFDEGTPVNVRRARKFFRWLVRGREWAQFGDPFSGLRAYRVMTIKRAIETRGTSRLLSWEGVAANAELLAQAVPHSRRNDTIDATVHYKRLQRASRFRFFAALSQVMGMRGGKTGPAAPVTLPDPVPVVPAALAVEIAQGHRREEMRRRPTGPRRAREGREGRPSRGPRDQREHRESRAPREGGKEQRRTRTRGTRPPRPENKVAAAPPAEVTDETAAVAPPAEPRERKRRRPRRRSRKPSQKADVQGTTAEAPQEGAVAPVEFSEGNGGGDAAPDAPRKKSRRGRRGGRGRRRGPRPEATGGETQVSDNNGEAAADAAQ